MLVKILLVFLIVTSAFGEHSQKEEEDDVAKAYKNSLVRNRTQEEISREKTKDYWRNNAMAVIESRLKQRANFNTAKNVILFMGDGMSIPTVAATRVYLGGEEMELTFEKFPFTGLAKTYCVDHQTSDSACSATAYLGGVKSNLGTIGVTAAVNLKNCSAAVLPENTVDSIARLFQLKGKRSGFVTSTRVTHASPAGIYAHTSERRWETDTDVIKSGMNVSECEDIAHQLIYGETGRQLNVIMGGGRKNFLPQTLKDEEGNRGDRTDEINLISEWSNYRKSHNQTHEYVWDRQGLMNVKNDTDFLLGLFESGHMKYNLDRNHDKQPSLEEMTEVALKVLQKQNSSGFFLFVEGGRIDTAHHHNMAHKALDETAEFAKAVAKALEMTNEEETLVVVTADHAHTMSYAGYAARGSNVFGYAGKGIDKKPYTILNYASGPGYKSSKEDGRPIPTNEELEKIDHQWPATIPRHKETHGADDVPVYAHGPWAHLFTGVIEQNVIPYLISLAACVSPDVKCEEIGVKEVQL